jgi:fucokinase
MSSAPTAAPSEISARARASYAAQLAGTSTGAWWDAVVLTASSIRQADGYREEIQRRVSDGTLPHGARYLVVPDVAGRRLGSGGATLNALRALGELSNEWWASHRVIMIHCGGDSRRLPQFSLSGKLFTTLPVMTPWGEPSTVFDETMALSSAWAGRLPFGLVVASGDVVLTFNPEGLQWDRPGITGVALLQPADVGSQHGVYVANSDGRVYTFLQKPALEEIAAAGGLIAPGLCAVDSGLLRFDPPSTAKLAALGRRYGDDLSTVDLYQHMTMALTGQWKPAPDAAPFLHELASALEGLPFWCNVLEGDFTHVGTTRSFHRILTEETDFTRLYEASQRLQMATPEGVQSAGVIVDSVLAGGGTLAPQSIVIECNLETSVEAARGVILHGLEGIAAPIAVPEDTVVHQVPVSLPDGRRGTVIRVYGLADDPKTDLWFGHPITERLSWLGIPVDAVWPADATERTLWQAQLFPVASTAEAWAYARWMMGLPSEYSFDRWMNSQRLSLASSSQFADSQEISHARGRRLQANWQNAALALAKSGADVRPLLANAPGMAALAAVGRKLVTRAQSQLAELPSEAASQFMQAALFLGRAGLMEESEPVRERAFASIQHATEKSASLLPPLRPLAGPVESRVAVSAAPRIDLGGGWSDTPPFCLDWGGTVVNIAVELGGEYPIRTEVRRLDEPLVRCIAEDRVMEYRSMAELLAPPTPGDPFLIARQSLQMLGLAAPGRPLPGLEIRTSVDLPMGSGLGTSSILGATVLQALSTLHGEKIEPQPLLDVVMRLEQRMTTGGGWQDQAGGIFPGAKLISSGPGLVQKVRVQPVSWSEARQREFASRTVLYYTGIQRMAKNLLRQVVTSYLARETATVQVLHSIKTLASEMAHAMTEGDWLYLGQLLDRHWKLNQLLDAHTTNAPISALIEEVRPYIVGAKLAGAGGGGFLILLGSSPEAAAALARTLSTRDRAGRVYEFKIATDGLRIEK